MKCVCIENEHNNTNFTLNKEYEVDQEVGVTCDWGGMWCRFKDWNRPQRLVSGDCFEFAMCKFKVC